MRSTTKAKFEEAARNEKIEKAIDRFKQHKDEDKLYDELKAIDREINWKKLKRNLTTLGLTIGIFTMYGVFSFMNDLLVEERELNKH